ncbi:Alpha-(1,3)-fucosyltransferase C [Orchesella cincta]|uniref:Fucosyltransferase n=1 Tax=Orchesella cincta TaxID=48709 RepID=A0A1D2NLX4_ORCCI|nr:Alpha-(1,3)-fucosyltransferase C [Orchesella cincta]
MQRWIYIICIHNTSESNNFGGIIFNIDKVENSKIVILVWTPYFGRRNGDALSIMAIHNNSYPECFRDCEITYDRNRVLEAHALVFHAWSKDLAMSDLPKNRTVSQLWVLLEQESPILARKDLDSFSGLFNWTMTYRKDSDVFHPYGKIVSLVDGVNKLDSKLDAFLSGKTKLVVGVISKCSTDSKREVLIDQLKKQGVPVDIFGKCGVEICRHGSDSSCSESEVWTKLSQDYKFYFAFENAICLDYVTEKLFRTLELGLVPVVYGGANYSQIAPPNSFIDVNDFKTPKELADFLRYLDRNPEEYKKFFEWRKKYKVMTGDGWCTLCKKLRNHELKRRLKERLVPKTYDKLKNWWFQYPFSSAKEERKLAICRCIKKVTNMAHRKIFILFFAVFLFLILYTILNVYVSVEFRLLSSEDGKEGLSWKLSLPATASQLFNFFNGSAEQVSLFLNETKDATLDTLVLRYDAACRIPKLDPFHSSIKHLLSKRSFTCEKEGYSLLFKSTLNSTLVPLKTLDLMENLGIKSCCYKTISRKDDSDKSYELSETCYPVSLLEFTVVPIEHDYLAISCEFRSNSSNSTSGNGTLISGNGTSTSVNGTFTKIVDMHAFVHLNASVKALVQNITEERLKGSNQNSTQKLVNVLVLGLDTFSRMSFIRQMPKSHSFLLNELDAVEIKGYNKIAHNTFLNVLATLTSLNDVMEKDINSSCKVNNMFDNCPFIWKNYSQHGFLTSYGEDGATIGNFNYLQKGFKTPPTDFYLRHFSLAADKLIKHSRMCFGPRFSHEVLLDYIQKFTYAMGSDNRYFQFIWSTALAHDYLNHGQFGDQPLRSTLEWLNNEGYLNQTILIVMSDHGHRFGGIMKYIQGLLENRMPLLYYVLPSWFKEKYARAYQNLKSNQDLLTTPFDLHETLKDLVTLESITAEQLWQREMILKNHENNSALPRGISHFLPIPLSRTCRMAGIENSYCVCRSLTDISTDNLAVRQAVYYAVYFINSIVSKYPQCAILSLGTVTGAMAGVGISGEEDYQINFETTPGDASLSATILRDKNGIWRVSGTIARINQYGNDSHCVENREAKMYCFCKDMASGLNLQP